MMLAFLQGILNTLQKKPALYCGYDAGSEAMRVALATTHVPLRDVADKLNKQLLIDVIEVMHRDLIDKFAIKKPRILVCGLNPHAGEAGHLGREEIDIIEPAIAELQNTGIDVTGPLAADTLFSEKSQHLRCACNVSRPRITST